MTTKIKVEEITITDLVREALTLPDGWKEEIYVENGQVVFSSPITLNTWVGKDDCPSEHLDSYIGDLHSLTWGEIEGFYERKDGKIELDNPYDGEEEGEYYNKVTVYTPEEAVTVLADYLDNDASEVAQLFAEITNPDVTLLPLAQATARGLVDTLIIDFPEKKWWKIDNEELETDHYGHLEVAVESRLSGMADVTETDTIGEAQQKIREFLLSQTEEA
jgi:hypothetical protein